MSISSILSNTASANIQNWQSLAQQGQQDFKSLAASLQSGSLGDAQQAYSEIAAMASANATGTSSALQSGPAQKDFTALGQDLAACNLSQAQSAFTQMGTDIKSFVAQNGGLHGHGGHCHRLAASSTASDPSLSTDATLQNATSSLLSQYGSSNPTGSSLTSNLLSMMG